MPNLSPQNLASVEIGKDFMLSHGYIKNDFDVQKWAAPEFLEQAARELLEEEWKKRTTAKLPETAAPLASGSGSGSCKESNTAGRDRRQHCLAERSLRQAFSRSVYELTR